LVKKEIFRRYNSGITPLRKPEIEKAVYIHDDITSSFKSLFRTDRVLYIDVINLLFGKRDIDRIDDVYTIERVLTKIRQLLVVSRIPVKRLSSKGQSLVGKFYSLLMEENAAPELLINEFRENSLLGYISFKSRAFTIFRGFEKFPFR
jgi:chromosomal replication initiation ATPase DnaA